MGGGPWASPAGQASLPAMWTGKVCELLPCPAQSIIQQMEHISHTGGERGWLGWERRGWWWGSVNTSHRLPLCSGQGFALLWGSGGSCSKRDGWGIWEQYKEKTMLWSNYHWSLSRSNRWSSIFLFKVSPCLHFLLNIHLLYHELCQMGPSPFSPTTRAAFHSLTHQTQVYPIILTMTAFHGDVPETGCCACWLHSNWQTSMQHNHKSCYVLHLLFLAVTSHKVIFKRLLNLCCPTWYSLWLQYWLLRINNQRACYWTMLRISKWSIVENIYANAMKFEIICHNNESYEVSVYKMKFNYLISQSFIHITTFCNKATYSHTHTSCPSITYL